MSVPVITAIPCLKDNYAWCIADRNTGTAVLIDPGEVDPPALFLEKNGLTLSQILLTHHHHDHVGGVPGLRERFPNVAIAGPEAERDRLPALDRGVVEGDWISCGSWNLQVLETPGHTAGHVSYYSGQGWLFCGDVLFSLGCGRCLECAHEIQWKSLERIIKLPEFTQICCGHEYTLNNASFALHVDPENQSLHARWEQAKREKRTVPVLLGQEIETNPFLRIFSPLGRKALGFGAEVDSVQAFSVLRSKRDSF
jgi:hydroxyacylglutathione hydrolase